MNATGSLNYTGSKILPENRFEHIASYATSFRMGKEDAILAFLRFID
jgi:hypothetical protein